MASGGTKIRVDIGVKNALQTLLQHAIDVGENGAIDPLIAHLPKLQPEAGKSNSIGLMIEVLLRQAGYSWDSTRVWLTAIPDKKVERRATAGPTTSRPATPRAVMQQLPTNLEHDAGTPTEATRAADAARPPEPGVMASTAPETLERLGPRGSGSVARPLEDFFDELVSTSYSIEAHLPCPHTWAQSVLSSPQPSLDTLSGGNIGEGETGGGWFGGGNAGLCELGGGRLGGGDAGGGEAGGGWLGDDDAAGGEAGGRTKRRRGSRGAGDRAIRGRRQ